jgi:hypothetical protein
VNVRVAFVPGENVVAQIGIIVDVIWIVQAFAEIVA